MQFRGRPCIIFIPCLVFAPRTWPSSTSVDLPNRGSLRNPMSSFTTTEYCSFAPHITGHRLRTNEILSNDTFGIRLFKGTPTYLSLSSKDPVKINSSSRKRQWRSYQNCMNPGSYALVRRVSEDFERESSASRLVFSKGMDHRYVGRSCFIQNRDDLQGSGRKYTHNKQRHLVGDKGIGNNV